MNNETVFLIIVKGLSPGQKYDIHIEFRFKSNSESCKIHRKLTVVGKRTFSPQFFR